jgi:hypothetical protein
VVSAAVAACAGSAPSASRRPRGRHRGEDVALERHHAADGVDERRSWSCRCWRTTSMFAQALSIRRSRAIDVVVGDDDEEHPIAIARADGKAPRGRPGFTAAADEDRERHRRGDRDDRRRGADEQPRLVAGRDAAPARRARPAAGVRCVGEDERLGGDLERVAGRAAIGRSGGGGGVASDRAPAPRRAADPEALDRALPQAAPGRGERAGAGAAARSAATSGSSAGRSDPSSRFAPAGRRAREREHRPTTGHDVAGSIRASVKWRLPRRRRAAQVASEAGHGRRVQRIREGSRTVSSAAICDSRSGPGRRPSPSGEEPGGSPSHGRWLVEPIRHVEPGAGGKIRTAPGRVAHAEADGALLAEHVASLSPR